MPPAPRHTPTAASVFRRRRVAAVVAVLILVGAIIALVVGGGGGGGGHSAASTSSTAAAPKGPARCPLTDEPAPGGKVPDRPALAVKIGNEPQGARPQSGLNEADIVYDTPAEGFIMRYVAVYQCQQPSSVGPTRSVRWVDWHLMQAFGHPILAFAGGINPDVNTVDNLSWLHPADLLTNPAAGTTTRITSRVPPDNLYVSTSKLWALFPKDHRPPPPVFSYGGALPAGAKAASSLSIDYSPGTDVVWKWDAGAHAWLHTYSGANDVDALTNKPVTATNVVVQIVHFTYGPYAESPGSTGDVESQTVGSGKGYVLRNGKEIAVTWHRPSLDSPTSFTDAAGTPVTLAPGRTWVELVLDVTANSPGALKINP